jgi:outer membrane biogenesis lipoprotein LolB
MLALIPEFRKKVTSALLFVAAAMLASCATKDPPRLVDDPDDHHASTIPWNKQEKWETGGQFAGMTDRR